MDIELRNRYEPIVRRYQLNVEHIEEYGNVMKIYTNQGPYALKKLPNQRLERNHFMHHIQFLKEKGFSNYVPIYHAMDGNYILSDATYSYYLMPWLEKADGNDEDNGQYHKMFQTLAMLHKKTVREESYTEEALENHYTNISDRWEQDGELLEKFLVQSESKWYMSPFELQYCTYFHHVMRARDFATKQLTDWYEVMKEKEKTRIALVHGNVSLNHFLFDYERNGYFISLERSQFATPIQDIVGFYTRSLNTYPIARSDRFEWYQEYQKHFPFTKEEQLLMFAYLTYPSPFIRQIRSYVNKKQVRNEQKEFKNVKMLQQSHWLVSNIEYFLSQLQAAQQENGS
ncbi:spore coat protein YsxE [Bacillus cytotoxicus]|uniref:spore coat protein YsxE n=1 Tax=Bacillus cytotoxicus TaxID=580165 RepID=UPI000863E6F9|nr:spore coat protein YsxE [Bacillus cytotoxicus]AWC29998.1 spore coat protein YsxE [Bacillus cytotoxicus]AWC42134.1 spore coat protein YsxE [Bacillus cytotoxicus]AWC50065.1 spore coat protein YsxE [Bacillus cytotoxicus]AWC54122.1 spore coat protein YsxE [Bacillus cytotoxicus]AWC58247.1 spore coat protein YsxE [Bacillus cytotoxicus]